MSRVGLGLGLACVGWLSGCAGSDALSEALARGSVEQALVAYDGLPAADLDRLAKIAERLLLDAANGADERLAERAFQELAQAGTHARPVLEALAESPNVTQKARALRLLVALGDGAARRVLIELVSEGPPELEALVLDAQPQPEVARVAQALGSVHASVRVAGVRAAQRTEWASATEALLAELVRLDPASEVRAAAAQALTRARPQAAGSLEAALLDKDQAVRAAALEALWTVASARAELHARGLWAADPTSYGLEAARRVLQAGRPQSMLAAARAYLLRGLEAQDDRLRAQAAVAVGGDDSQVAPALAARLELETVPSVQLALALALGPQRAVATLTRLVAGADVTAVEAAAALAKHGDAVGLGRLRELRSAAQPIVRRAAFVALGRGLGRASELRPCLSDPDAEVRLACAGAVLTGRSGAARSAESS